MSNYKLDYIKNGISEGLELCDNSNCDFFHHNTEYKNILNILKYGILPIKKLQSENIVFFEEEQLVKLSDTESHINGIDGISVAKVGLTDLYQTEEIYEPFRPSSVDIIISNNIKASRNSSHYGNEYICYNPIPISKIISLDFRILELIKKCDFNNLNEINSIITKYNFLISIIKKVQDDSIPVLLREMSNESSNINTSKVLKLEQLSLEK